MYKATRMYKAVLENGTRFGRYNIVNEQPDVVKVIETNG